MSDVIIKVDNLSKQYRLGEVGTGSLSHDINLLWHKIMGKDNPYLRVGENNDRAIKGKSEYVWALKDINFEVKRGEVLGIIGRNGAGKSTLLKILSKTTAPTTGTVRMKGRVASLLEVGTGFHPDLSGKENIFLNGAILGMTKREIKSKFEEIVDFSGVERYIETPVKRYSSGMYVRLAFAVAAHLESEILIVDEVLAVGDAEFQKKCMGKMGEVSANEGRTVFFVSHNMASVQNLCTNALLLNRGMSVISGDKNVVIDHYLSKLVVKNNIPIKDRIDRKGNGSVRITDFSLDIIEGLHFIIEYESERLNSFKGRVLIAIYDLFENAVIFLDSSVIKSIPTMFPQKATITIKINSAVKLTSGTYNINIAMLVDEEWVDHIESALTVNIEDMDFYESGKSLYFKPFVHVKQDWQFQNY